MSTALILSDEKPGHLNQSVALASMMKWDTHIVPVHFKHSAAKSASYLLDRLQLYTPALLTPLSALSKPDVIISTGSATFYANQLLAKRWRIPNIAILYPRGYRLDFHHIFCPAYDNPPNQSNITALPINLSYADATWYRQQAETFQQHHHKTEKESVGIVIGGNSRRASIQPDQIKAQLTEIFERTPEQEHWLTTSRRTPPSIIALLKTFPFDYQLIWHEGAYNPLPAFIETCQHLFITADSASMMSEAVSHGNAAVTTLPVLYRAPDDKLQRFVSQLEAAGCVTSLQNASTRTNKKINLQPLIEKALG